jgi:hypothetical protein
MTFPFSAQDKGIRGRSVHKNQIIDCSNGGQGEQA